ncbi:FN3 associated domain-containing protein [Lewinella sp. W8]|uniref:FN3 associated domain-containing protein n=1 Tax=Lewinella sp. W8 TaxID=2528208 RepID=UPI001068331C|nr:FN3 associated domain-containing protein [Lewinella sp. W8]MTB51704.1 hypothetical protein [Lewinella sp. W8]
MDALLYFGRFHPLLLHLPIGILLYVYLHWGYAQLLGRKQRPPNFNFALGVGLATSLATTITGLLLANGGGYEGELLERHKYAGIAVTLGVPLVWWAYRRWKNRGAFGLLFTALIGLVAVTGHLGGSLTHGEDFLTRPLRIRGQTLPKNLQEAHVFEQLVLPIVERKCVSCHNPQKAKGELLLHDLNGWRRGGENGQILVAGMAEESPLIQRIFLPKGDEQHMPPSGKLQLTVNEKNFLRWWVDSMDGYEARLESLAQTPAVAAYLDELRASNAPQIDAPSPREIQRLRQGGFLVEKLSANAPWIAVAVAEPDSFSTDALSVLRRVGPAIRELNLAKTGLEKERLHVLGKLPHLQRLDLSHTAVSAASLTGLAGLENLAVLNLVGTRVDTSIFTTLRQLPRLEKLYVWRTPLEQIKGAFWEQHFPGLEVIGGVDVAQFGRPKLVAPLIVAEAELFVDSLLIELETKAPRGEIRYTLDGSTPGEDSPVYTGPFHLRATSEVRAVLAMDGWEDSDPVSKVFMKSGVPVARIDLATAPNEKYRAEGGATLADLEKGSTDFSDGKWLGFEGKDLRLTADLGAVHEISGVTIGALNAPGAYIHLPLSISVASSVDGDTFTPLQRRQYPAATELTEPGVRNYLLSGTPRAARFLRIEVESQRVNPPWHPAPGANCWLFVDEVLVE